MYSEVVDRVIARTSTPGRTEDAQAFVNQAVRECNALQLFYKSTVEDQLTITANPFIWTRPSWFRSLRIAQNDTTKDYFVRKLPGPGQDMVPNYFYASGDSIIFSGTLTTSDLMNVFYYTHSPLNSYTAVAARAATFDEPTQIWTYTVASTDAEKEAARAIAGNHWLLTDWSTLIEQGAVAKVYNSRGDDRGPREFAIYTAQQKTMVNSEAFEGQV